MRGESPQRAVRQTPVNRSMSGPLALVGALLLLAPISCATVFAGDFGQAGDDWRIWVDDVKTSYWGESYVTGAESCEPPTLERGEWCTPISYEPGAGQRFLYVALAIRNLSTESRTFDLNAVRLGGDEVEATPSVFDMNWSISWEANPYPKLDPGEEITRKLIFAFPEHLDPDRLSVIGLVLAFPDPVRDD